MSPGNYSGRRWRTNREAALRRDNYRCQDCGSQDHLHVHHITPVREFDVAAEAHYLRNLVTLCKYCHPKWEKKEGRPRLIDGDGGVHLADIVTTETIRTLMDCTKFSDLGAVFQEYIQNDSGICDKCYKRVRQYHPPPEKVHRTSLQHVESGEGDHILRGETFRGGDGVYCYPPSKDGTANDGGRIVCEDCGEVDYIPEARKMGDFIKCSHRLRQRLLEKGFGINDDAFYQTIRTLKEDPQETGKEFVILEKATQRGIRAAWEIRGHPYPEDEVERGDYLDEL